MKFYISGLLSHSIDPAVTNDSSNPLLQSTDASRGLNDTSLGSEGNSLKRKGSDLCAGELT